MPSDWHYGEALIADALKRKDFAQAGLWMERTFASFARWPEDEVWHPEDSLLPPAGHYYYGPATSDDALKLLEQWETIALKGKAPGRAASCQLQRAVLTSDSDWPEVLRAFDAFQRQGGTEVSLKSSLPTGATGRQARAPMEGSRSSAR